VGAIEGPDRLTEPGQAVLGWMSGTGYRLVLLVGLLLAAWIGWNSWRRTRALPARMVWLGAMSVLAGVSVWLVFDALAAFVGLDPRLWAAPLERLLGVAVLVTLGWTLDGTGAGGRQWRVFLGCGLAVAAVAYLGWAPLWAQAARESAALEHDATGLARAWDVWQVVLALAVGIALFRLPRAPRWVLGVVAGLALGSFLELVVPLSVAVPAWSRLGTLVAGTFIVAAALSQTAALRHPLEPPWRLQPLRRRGDPRATPAPGRPGATPGSASAAPMPAAPMPAATMPAATIPAAPTPAIPTPAVAPTADPQLAVVLSELRRQGSAVDGLAAAVAGLNDRLDRFERQATTAVPAPTAAPTVEPAEDPHPPAPERDLTIAAVAALEADPTLRRPATAEPELAAVMAQRLRLERSLDQLPWGVIVADAADRVAFANPAAGHCLHRRRVQPGEPVVPLFPNAERLGYALHRARHASAVERAAEPITLRFEAPNLRAQVEPLSDPEAGYLGTAIILTPPAVEVGGLSGSLVPALADALRSPLTSILGYSELLGGMRGLTEDQVQRYLQRIDANLSRLRVMLGNLLAVLEVFEATTLPAPEAVDVPALVRDAVGRAGPQLAEKALAVEVRLDEPLPPASAMAGSLPLILDNLLVQAISRSPQGGDVTVGAALREELGGRRAIVLTIQDHGSPLATGPSGTLEIDEGGARPVALTVVRLLAERLGGRAWAESDAGGARFLVRLPVQQPG
jgi:hypothetical protein